MKNSFANRIQNVLKAAHIPAAIIAMILTIGKNRLVNIVFSHPEELKKIPGIADKRMLVIVSQLKKVILNGRISEKAEKREKAPGYSCRTFDANELWRDELDLSNEIKQFDPKTDDPKVIAIYAAKVKELENKIFSKKLTVRHKAGRIVRLNKSATSEVAKIDYENKKPTEKIVVVEHGIQEMFNFSYKIFNNDAKIGMRMKDEFQKRIERYFMYNGIRVISDNGTKLYGGAASSASHQKGEKIMMIGSAEMRNASEFFWFGHGVLEFATSTEMTGAELWKARANLIRPWMKPFTTKDGYVIRMSDVLFVKDVEKIYIIKNGRRIGKLNGKLVRDGEDTEVKVLGDGSIVSLVELAFQGQCSSTGLKGFFLDGTSSIEYVCKKYSMTREEFMDLQVEGIDGRMHRIGDYKAISGEGCWKLDKAFGNFDEYMAWLGRMAETYNGIDCLYLLRQSEEIEDEEKVRRLTKTLIQQWMIMSASEIRKLTRKARKDLEKAKTFTESVKKLAALWKNPEDRTQVENLFYTAPWLVMNPVIQDYLKDNWKRKVIEAASCKFRTEGQYPYIAQDPVALLEVWVLGKDPNAEDLGVLRGDEVSVADVPEGKELLCVRFPANFLTAMVMTNRACTEEFGSMNGVMVLSVHSDILIRQDGDVDGDEMCVIYDKLAIELTKRMNEKFNPPVVLFAHGGKPARHTYASVEEFINDSADALWRAKRYDSVGLYANLAMKCAYLAAIRFAQNDEKLGNQYLLWMSAASTGAILAIDQVKGNDVDESLIDWLESIRKKVNKEFKNIACEMGFSSKEAGKKLVPFTHYFNELAKRRQITMDVCLPAHDDNFVDQISSIILNTAGSWDQYDSQGVIWDAKAAEEALMYDIAPISVKSGKVTKKMMDLLGDNWFKFAAKAGDIDPTKDTLRKIRLGTEIGMKELMLLLWQNEASMAYSMEGRTLWEKKEEYYDACRELIRLFLESGNWKNEYAKSYPVGYEFNMDERWKIAVNAIVKDALELVKNNGIENGKGKYAMFTLRVFAKDLMANVLRNRVDNTRFFAINMDDMLLDIDYDRAIEELELFEDISAPVAEEEDEVPAEFHDDEYLGWDISNDEIPEEILA